MSIFPSSAQALQWSTLAEVSTWVGLAAPVFSAGQKSLGDLDDKLVRLALIPPQALVDALNKVQVAVEVAESEAPSHRSLTPVELALWGQLWR
eukprot:940784-Amphidinium_carterae.1